MIGVTKLSRGYSKECFPLSTSSTNRWKKSTSHGLQNRRLHIGYEINNDFRFKLWRMVIFSRWAKSALSILHLKTRMEKIRVVLFLQLNITRNSASALVKFKLVHSSVHCTRSALTEPELVILAFASDSFECDNVLCVLVAQTTGSSVTHQNFQGKSRRASF